MTGALPTGRGQPAAGVLAPSRIPASLDQDLLFLTMQVIEIITAEIMPLLRESGMSGQVEYFSDMRIFNDHPRSAQVGGDGWGALTVDMH